MRFLLLTLAVLLAGSSHADDLERQIPVDGAGTLHIALDRGDVDVIAHDGGEVRLEARARGLGAGAVHFRVREEGPDVVLESRTDEWLAWLSRGPRVHVRAWVPHSYSLAVETSGDVVTNVHGVRVSHPARAPAPSSAPH